MRVHQRYFCLRDPKTGGCASTFLFVANKPEREDSEGIRQGNENVLRARLERSIFL